MRFWISLLWTLPALAHVWIGGEALFLRPTLNLPYSAIITPNNALPTPADGGPLNGEWRGLTKPSYEWGYRIEAGATYGCFDLSCSWTSWITSFPSYLKVGTDERLWFMYIHPSVGQDYVLPGKLTRTDELKYQSIDAEVEQQFNCIRIFGGVRYMRLLYRNTLLITGTNQSNQSSNTLRKYESDMQGTGMRTGAQFNMEAYWGLQCFAKGSAALLLGSSKGRLSETQRRNAALALATDLPLAAHLVIGNVEAHFGFSSTYRLSWIALEAEIGYLLNYFSPGMTTEQFLNDADSQSMVARRPFALDGWSFCLRGRY